MKQNKTLKSFTELSADSLRVVDAENESAEPLKFDAPAEPPQNNLSKSPPRESDVRGRHHWGINE